MRKYLLLFLFFNLTACGTREFLAPVDEVNWTPFNSKAATYKVRRGDTLYSIAFLYDADYKKLAQINHMSSPYHLSVGQVIKLRSSGQVRKLRSGRGRSHSKVNVRNLSAKPRVLVKYSANSKWLWPVSGDVKNSFSPSLGQKGINIAARKGSKVRASRYGVVAYAGNGLENYGNLIIIKHKDNYLTAYGNNSRNLVREGQVVQAGQIIAEIGVVNRRYYGLHFEIRKNGKPVNPLLFLFRSKPHH